MTLAFHPLASGPLAAVSGDDSHFEIDTFKIADRGLIFADNSFYEARLLTSVTVSQSAMDRFALGGRVALTASEVTLANGDRGLDSIIALNSTLGRRAVIKTTDAPYPVRSDCGGDIADAKIVFTGVVAAWGPAGRTVRLAFGDFTERLNVPLQQELYDGAGGTGGSAELTGLPKPISLGWRFNPSPVYIGLVDFGDGALPTYQSHWRAIVGHDDVRERGVAMTEVLTAPGIGQWRDWPDQGCFQLGFVADGAVTCDVQGDNVGDYAGTTSAVIKRLLTSLGPELADADFDDTSFTLVGVHLPGEIGWGIGTEGISALDALEQILGHCGAVMCGNRAGLVRIAIFAPAGVTAQATLDASDICALEPTDLPRTLTPTPQAVSIIGKKNWTPLTDFAGSVTGTDRDALAGTGSRQRAFSSSVASRLALVSELNFDGLYRNPSDALARATVIRDWVEGGLKAFTLTTDRYLNQFEIGHTVRITDYPFYGLSSGFLGVVAEWKEQPDIGRVTITIVG